MKIIEILDSIFNLYKSCGFVGLPLFLSNGVLWGSIFTRAVEVNNNSNISQQNRFLNTESLRVVTTCCVISAPLLGLLGTVSGMIEMFSSLGSMTLTSQSKSLSGGISQALITTEMGLVIAIPGLIFHRLLLSKEEKYLSEENEEN